MGFTTTTGEGRRRRRRRDNDDDGDLDVIIANDDDDDDDDYDDYRYGGYRGNTGPRRSDIDRDRMIIRESSSRLHHRDIDEYDVGTLHRWRSPLEGLSPLPTTIPSLSSPRDCHRRDILPSHTSSFSRVSIGPGMRHSHEIDVLEKIRQRTTSSSSYAPSPSPPKMKLRSTGTTIVALLAENSTVLILAADTRATDGNTVADKRCSKLHVLSSNVWCAGAGTSADVEAIVRRTRYALMKSGRLTLEGHGGIGNSFVEDDEDEDYDRVDGDDDRDNDYRGKLWDVPSDDVDIGPHPPPPPASVVSVIHRLRSQLREGRGGIGANILAGGYDMRESRAILAAIHPHGSVDIVNYSALGSGGLAAMGVLESRYPGSSSSPTSSSMISCTTIEGIRLAVDAVRAGIDNDLGSGSQVDVCVIGRRGVFYRRAVAMEEELRWTTTSDGNDYGRMASVGSGDGADGAIPRILSSESAGGGRDIGVNGFGNVPFAIQSKRVVCGGRYDLDAERERNRWLDEVLSP